MFELLAVLASVIGGVVGTVPAVVAAAVAAVVADVGEAVVATGSVEVRLISTKFPLYVRYQPDHVLPVTSIPSPV